MQGVVDIQRPMTAFDRRLELMNNMVSDVLTGIIQKFVSIQTQNPFLAMEILFKFTSQEKISQALNNYFLDAKNTAG